MANPNQIAGIKSQRRDLAAADADGWVRDLHVGQVAPRGRAGAPAGRTWFRPVLQHAFRRGELLAGHVGHPGGRTGGRQVRRGRQVPGQPAR